MVSKDYEPTTHPWHFIVFAISFISILVAFFSPYWLRNDGELEEPAFSNTGLWQICFNNYEDFKYQYDRVYEGCYWTLAEEMHVRADQLKAPFFVTVQVFFTFCFTLSLVAAALVMVLALCPGEDFEKTLLKLTYNICFVSWFFGFIAVIVFGAMGDNRDWMPHWEHNYLSWSFAIVWYEPTDVTKSVKPWNDLLHHLWPQFTSPNLREFTAMIRHITRNSKFAPSLQNKTFHLDILNASHAFNWSETIALMITLGADGFMIVRKLEEDVDSPLLLSSTVSSITDQELVGLHFKSEKMASSASVSGAGDCLAAGFISGMLQNKRISECSSQGLICSDLSLKHSEAVPQTLDSIRITLKPPTYTLVK